MALLPFVRDINQVPEAFRGEYRQDAQGVWRLDVTPTEGYALENISGLRTALDTERGKVAKMGERLKGWDGLDRSQVDRDLAAFKALEGAVPKDQVETLVQKRIGDTQAEWQAKLEAANKRAETADGALDLQAKKTGIEKALAGARLDPILSDHLSSMVQVERGADGVTRTLKLVDPVTNLTPIDGAGQPLTLEGKAAALAADKNYERFVLPEEASGPGLGSPPAGAERGAARTGAPVRLNKSDPIVLGENLDKLAAGEATFDVDVPS